MKDYITALAQPVGALILGLIVVFYGGRRNDSGSPTLTGVPVSPGMEALEELGLVDGSTADVSEAIELAKLTPPDRLIPYLITDLNAKARELRALDAAKDYWRDWARDHVARVHPDMPMPPEYQAPPKPQQEKP